MRGWMAIAALASLAGCASAPMTADQCTAVDWRQIGYQEGLEGRGTERFMRRQGECAALGMAPDPALYHAGRAEGLAQYCVPERGFAAALNGGSYAGVCPPELDYAFRAAFSDGARAHSALAAVRSAESAINSARSERDDLERKISANELGLIRSTTDAERERHRAELERLRDERSEVNARLREAELNATYGARDLDRTRRELGFRYGDW